MKPLLVCYLDESGTDKQSPIVTSGVYIALVSAWSDFAGSRDRMNAA